MHSTCHCYLRQSHGMTSIPLIKSPTLIFHWEKQQRTTSPLEAPVLISTPLQILSQMKSLYYCRQAKRKTASHRPSLLQMPEPNPLWSVLTARKSPHLKSCTNTTVTGRATIVHSSAILATVPEVLPSIGICSVTLLQDIRKPPARCSTSANMPVVIEQKTEYLEAFLERTF